MFMRVAKCYSDNDAHAQRIYDYISKMWFMPATPVSLMGEQKEACQFHVSKHSPRQLRGNIIYLGRKRLACVKWRGIGTYWGEVRSMEKQLKSPDKLLA